MVSLSIIFAAIPAVIYLAAGLPVTAGTVSIGTLIAFTARRTACSGRSPTCSAPASR